MNFHPVTVVALEPSPPPPPLNPRPEEVSRRTAASGGGRGSLTGAKKILCFSFFLRKEKEGLKGGGKNEERKGWPPQRSCGEGGRERWRRIQNDALEGDQ